VLGDGDGGGGDGGGGGGDGGDEGGIDTTAEWRASNPTPTTARPH
jgi:hypothetical protein